MLDVVTAAFVLATSDVPIPLFTSQSDTDTFYFKTSQYQYFTIEALYNLAVYNQPSSVSFVICDPILGNRSKSHIRQKSN